MGVRVELQGEGTARREQCGCTTECGSKPPFVGLTDYMKKRSQQPAHQHKYRYIIQNTILKKKKKRAVFYAPEN